MMDINTTMLLAGCAFLVATIVKWRSGKRLESLIWMLATMVWFAFPIGTATGVLRLNLADGNCYSRNLSGCYELTEKLF